MSWPQPRADTAVQSDGPQHTVPVKDTRSSTGFLPKFSPAASGVYVTATVWPLSPVPFTVTDVGRAVASYCAV